MAQRSQMYYAYFRFYVDDATIEAGMNQYCTDWERMFAVGYNYQEYKCFVDNLGGFEHWVGDMRGYISQSRETGFLDGSPSDTLYDSTLIMGASKHVFPNMSLIHVFPDCKFFVRKIIAQDAGIAHKISVDFGDSQKLEHPVMYTYEGTQIEIFDYNQAVVDESDVDSYSVTIDVPKTTYPLTVHSSQYFTSPEKAVNGGWNDYATATSGLPSIIVFDLGAVVTLHNVCAKYHNVGAGTATKLYHSVDGTTFTEFYSKNESGGVHWYTPYQNLGVQTRYIKFYVNTNLADRLYQIIAA